MAQPHTCTEAARSFRKGRACLRSRDWAGAAGALRRATELDDSHGEWFHDLGLALQKLEDWPQAGRALTEAVRRDAGASDGQYRLDWRHRLAFIQRVLGEPAATGETYRAAAASDPGLAAWWSAFGEARRDTAETRHLALLWDLVDATGTDSENAALSVIADAENRPHLYPDKWWYVASFALYRRGFVRAAYAARRVAASVLRASYPAGSEPGNPLPLAAAIADGGDVDAALTRIRSAMPRSATDPALARALAENAAAFEALRGRMTEAWNLWRQCDAMHPRPDEEQHFRALVTGRRIAVVAPSATMREQGREIDAHDLVVRTNFHSHAVIEQHARAIGSRTDISYYNGDFEPDNRAAILSGLAERPLQFMVLRFEDPAIEQYAALLPVRVSHLVNPFYRMNCYAVPKIVYDLLRFQPRVGSPGTELEFAL